MEVKPLSRKEFARMLISEEGTDTDLIFEQRQKAFVPIEVAPSLMITFVIDDLNDCHGTPVQSKSVMFPVPEIVRVLEVPLKNHLKLAPHEPESSPRTPLRVNAYTSMNWRTVIAMELKAMCAFI